MGNDGHNKELERIEQTISDRDQARRYDSRLVAELLVCLGPIHNSPESKRRWS
jgi:hypothetical protein